MAFISTITKWGLSSLISYNFRYKTLEICYLIFEPVYLSYNGFIIRKQKEAVMQMAISVVAKEFIQTRHFHCFCSTFCVPDLFLPFENSNYEPEFKFNNSMMFRRFLVKIYKLSATPFLCFLSFYMHVININTQVFYMSPFIW